MSSLRCPSFFGDVPTVFFIQTDDYLWGWRNSPLFSKKLWVSPWPNGCADLPRPHGWRTRHRHPRSSCPSLKPETSRTGACTWPLKILKLINGKKIWENHIGYEMCCLPKKVSKIKMVLLMCFQISCICWSVFESWIFLKKKTRLQGFQPLSFQLFHWRVRPQRIEIILICSSLSNQPAAET